MILAIDPSLSNTACVYGNAQSCDIATFGSPPDDGTVAARVARYSGLCTRVIDWINSRPIEAIYIEGYSLSSNRPGDKFLTEFGGVLRWTLASIQPRFFEIPPSTLKKFVTGKGSDKKEIVAANITKRWGVLFETTDEFDAYGCYRLGLVAEGLADDVPKLQREVALAVVAPKVKKPRKKKQTVET
jgi:Holliday junction resolvasome RuvABC endonuclease subunit